MNVLNLHSLLVICLVSFSIKQLAKLVYGFRKQFLIADFTLVRDFMATLYISRRKSLTLLAQCSITTKVRALRI